MFPLIFQEGQPTQLQGSSIGSSSSTSEVHSHSLIPSSAGPVAESPQSQEWHVSFVIPELEVFLLKY